MNLNLKSDDLKKEIINIINESQVPVVIIYYIIKDLFNQIQRQYYGTINELRLKNQKKVEMETQGKIEEHSNQNV